MCNITYKIYKCMYYIITSHPTVYPRLLDLHPTVPFCFLRIRTSDGSLSCSLSTRRSGLGHPLDYRSYFLARILVDLLPKLPENCIIHYYN